MIQSFAELRAYGSLCANSVTVCMTDLIGDLRFALRQLVKSPGFTIVCALTIALGIGANTAVFTVMNTVLLRYLPVPEPRQLIYFHLDNQPLGTSQTGYNDTSLSLPMYQAMRSQKRIFSDVVAHVPLAWQKVAVRVGSEPEEATGEMVSGNFFSGLRVPPFMGRAFSLADERTHAPIAVVSYDWWTRRMAQDRSAIGRIFYVKGVAVTIVGVAPPGFVGADPDRPEDFWIPLQNRPELTAWGQSASDSTLYGSPHWLCLLVIGRLQAGVTPAKAVAELTGPFRRALMDGIQSPDAKGSQQPRLYFTSLRGVENLRDDYSQSLYFLMTMVGLVLVIACANVAMLLIARNTSRRREFAVRLALGATSLQIFRQLFIESVLLVSLGAGLGLSFAPSATQALTKWSGTDLNITPDRTVLLFTMAVAAAVALLFGVAPIGTVTRIPASAAMKTSAATANTDTSRQFGRKAVLAMQVALCFVLLVAAGLLFSTIRNLQSSKVGLRTDGLLVFGIDPHRNIRTSADSVRFHRQLLEQIRALPGIESATVTENRMGAGTSNNETVALDGQVPTWGGKDIPLRVNNVGSSFLHTFGIPLLEGRDISDTDTATSEKVAIVNETFVKQCMQGKNPLGHQIGARSEKTQYRIVGVAKDFRYTGLREKPRAMAFLPFTQLSNNAEMHYAVHTYGNPNSLLPEIAAAVRRFDPDLPIERPVAQRVEYEKSVSQERLTSNLAAFFGILAALLVAIGLYGTLAFRVSRRTMEIGIRMAIGAPRSAILWMVLRESLLVAGIGLAAGVPLAMAAAQTLRSTLYGLQPLDPTTFAAALGCIALVALLASYLPARRAATIDPLQSLRTE